MISDLLSVIMPAYNAEHYIVEALESVLAQPDQAIQVIVVDDGSTDATIARASTLDARITVLQQPHRGIFAALNHGIRAADGEWLTFQDADDLWPPGSLAARFAPWRSDNPPNYVFGHVQNFYSPETDAAYRARIVCPPEPQIGIGYNTLLLRREDFLCVGLFDERWQFGGLMEWLGRADALGFSKYIVPQVVLFRRLHANNTTIREHEARQDYARVLKELIARRRAAKLS